jgi:predicted permease
VTEEGGAVTAVVEVVVTTAGKVVTVLAGTVVVVTVAGCVVPPGDADLWAGLIRTSTPTAMATATMTTRAARKGCEVAP